MAKFNNKHLKLRDNQRVYFGDSDDTSFWFDGTELRVATTISGVDPTQSYHLTTKNYVDNEITTLSGSIADTSTFVKTDGSRPFTSTIDGVYPTASGNLATKQYVDDEISTLSSSIVTDHGSLTGLSDDDHTQYVPTNGSRGFTATVSGIDPTASYHLATKNYVDGQTGGLHKSGRTTLALNDANKAVTFGTAYADTNYSVSLIMSNTVDATPSIYPMMVTAKATTGFTVLFSGDIDSNNYVLEWIAKHD